MKIEASYPHCVTAPPAFTARNAVARWTGCCAPKKLGFTLTRIQRLPLNNAEAGIAESLAPGEIVAQLSVLERQKANLDQAIMDLRAAHAQVGGQGQPMARAG